MTIRDIAVAFGVEVDKNSVSEAENRIKGIKSLATKLLGAVGVVFSIQGLASLAEAAANVEALNSQFTQVFGEMEETAAEKLQAIADDTGVAVNRMKGSYTQIAAFSKTTGLGEAESLEVAERAMVAVADSAAFYDRSIEDVTTSVRSFLKGNYEQDAALGLSCTETTRNTAANKLYGKSFKDLSEAEKQFTLLSMIEDANEASGAIGQAARESDTWTNQLGNLQQALKDLQAAAGSTFLKPAVQVLKTLTALVQKATTAFQYLTREGGFLAKETERFHALVKRLQPAIDRMTQTLRNGLNKGVQMAKNVTDKLGGVDNTIRILSTVAAAFLLVMNWSKVIAGAKMFGSALGALKTIFGSLNTTTLAVVAVVAALALIVEDFYNFMIGNDSLIGEILEDMGIDADEVRQAFETAFEAISTAVGIACDAVGTAIGVVVDALGDVGNWITEHEGVMNTLVVILGSIASAFVIVKGAIAGYNIVSGICSTVTGVMTGAFGAASAAGGVLAGVIGFITSPVTIAIAAISALIAIGVLLYQNWETVQQYCTEIWEAISGFISETLETISGVFDEVWNGISEFVTGIWDGITSAVETGITDAQTFVSDGLNAVSGFFTDIFTEIETFVATTFDNILSSVTGKVGDIAQSITDGFNDAIEFIKGLPDEALSWGADIITGICDGINNAIGGVTDAISNVAENIKSFLHFSVPDKGPLTEFESWMPDFMSGLAAGIEGSQDTLLDKVRGVANSVSLIMQGATASAATAANTQVNNATSNMTQNVNISNSYSGTSTEAQKNVSKAMNKSAVDATTYMARGLAYARG